MRTQRRIGREKFATRIARKFALFPDVLAELGNVEVSDVFIGELSTFVRLPAPL